MGFPSGNKPPTLRLEKKKNYRYVHIMCYYITVSNNNINNNNKNIFEIEIAIKSELCTQFNVKFTL